MKTTRQSVNLRSDPLHYALNQKLGGRLRQKGYANRAVVLGWAILTHNLWLVARRLAAQQQAEQAEAA